jgi:hypothetical protein
VRTKTLLGLTAAAAAVLLPLAAPAQAASLPCGLGSNANNASATCWSGSSYTWRLAVDCLDTSNIKWPKVVNTLYGAWITGDGTESLSCKPAYKASARLEAK